MYHRMAFENIVKEEGMFYRFLYTKQKEVKLKIYKL